MVRRDPALLKRLRLHLDGARRLSVRPGETGPQKNGFEERPWRASDFEYRPSTTQTGDPTGEPA
jgi:hypothetical protein